MLETAFDKQFDILGYETGREITKIDEELLCFKNAFSNKDLHIKSDKWFYNRKKLVENTEHFFNQFLSLREVRYISDKNKKRIIFKEGYLDDNKDIIKLELNNSLKMISPFDLPVFNKDYSALVPFFYDDSVYLTGICLESKKSKEALCNYSHEIIHGQLYMQKGSVINYKNSEVLSIFFEFLSAFYFEKSGMLLNNMIKQRCENTIRMINLLIVNVDDFEMKLTFSSYVESSLIAIKLFDLYMKSNIFIKKEITEDIQGIIDGIITLEDMMNKYEINFENSKKENLFKKYVK